MDERPKSSFWKFIAGFLFIVFGTIFSYVGLKIWVARTQAENARHIVDRIEEQARKSYEIAMQDTYGGKTPQETLRLYIEAVENGDYVLASKYFIGDYQEREVQSFSGATQSQISQYIELVKAASKNFGDYTLDEQSFSIDKPISVRMRLYPSGIWKIIEI